MDKTVKEMKVRVGVASVYDNKEYVRRRIFELIKILYKKERQERSIIRFYINQIRTIVNYFRKNKTKNGCEIEEVKELVFLLVEHNPYEDGTCLTVEFLDEIFHATIGEAAAQYCGGRNQIEFSEKSILSNIYQREWVSTLETIGHEKHHHSQYTSMDNPSMSSKISKGEMFDYEKGYLKKEQCARLIDFVNKYTTEEQEKISWSVDSQALASYYAREHEITARAAGFEYARIMTEKLQQDEFCDEKTRRKLEHSFKIYIKRKQRYGGYLAEYQSAHMKLVDRLKEIFDRFMKDDNINQEEYNDMLLVVHDAWPEIFAYMGAEEVVKYYYWAKKNDSQLLEMILHDIMTGEHLETDKKIYTSILLAEATTVDDYKKYKCLISTLSSLAKEMDNEKEIITDFLCNVVRNGQLYILFSEIGNEYDKERVESEILEITSHYASLAEKVGDIDLLWGLKKFFEDAIECYVFSQNLNSRVKSIYKSISAALERERTKVNEDSFEETDEVCYESMCDEDCYESGDCEVSSKRTESELVDSSNYLQRMMNNIRRLEEEILLDEENEN